MSIPNNVGLADNPTLHRKLMAYQAKFRVWWRERGPNEFHEQTMSLRVPTGETRGRHWAAYREMRPCDYVWGIYTAPDERSQIAYGDNAGRAGWNSPPQEYRLLLIDHIRVQADVENAAIEQSSTLTGSAPSREDLNNLFQFFLEEGRHTWAMVHLLLEHFGRDGEDEADALLSRMSGDAERPRLLDAFNHHTDDWLSHYMWCFLADRVGKFQVQAATQSAFLPLAASTKFMMLEEPLHITFGLAGLERVIHRSVEVTLRKDRADIFEAGAIPLPVIQQYFNHWISKIYDLFGNDSSTRSRDLYRYGIRSPRNFDPDGADVDVDVLIDGRLEQVAFRPEEATNAIMRRQYMAEIGKIFERWNASLQGLGIDFRLQLPHDRFNRKFGPCAGLPFDVDGRLLAGEGAAARIAERLPNAADTQRVRDLMSRRLRPGECAPWLAPPSFRFNRAND